MLPEIKSSSEVYGKVCDGSALDGLQISGVRLNIMLKSIYVVLIGSYIDFRQSAVSSSRTYVFRAWPSEEHVQKWMFLTLQYWN